MTNSSLEVANPKSLLSVTTLRGSVHLDIAEGAQSSCASIKVHKPEKGANISIIIDFWRENSNNFYLK